MTARASKLDISTDGEKRNASTEAYYTDPEVGNPATERKSFQIGGIAC